MTDSQAIAGDGAAEHPAFRAWTRLRGGETRPMKIEVLKVHGRKTMVCRLSSSGTAGEDVIAKRSFKKYVRVERTIYEDVLPDLPVSSLRYYGSTEDEDPNYGWLFIEDAGGRAFISRFRAHRIAAGRWLGTLHTSSAYHQALSKLPDRGPRHYLECLRSTRQWIEKTLSLELEPDGLESLQMIISNFDRLEGQWNQLLEFCDRLPRTLVHGDFSHHNIRIRAAVPRRGVPTLVSFDWAEAGSGVPPVDILGRFGHSGDPDIHTYWLTVRKPWSLPSIETIKRFGIVGKTFRAISAISWEFPSSEGRIPEESGVTKIGWTGNIPWNLRLYGLWLGECLEEIGRF